MRVSLQFFEHLRNKITLSEVIKHKVSITRKGIEYVGLCPFHSEKTPSFTVNDLKRFYHCFGCGAHGDVIKFISAINVISYKDAAIALANDYNIEIPKLNKEEEKLYEEEDEILDILQKASDFFQSQLTHHAIKYLFERSISSKSIKDFNIGFSTSGNNLINYFKERGVLLDKLIKAGLIAKKPQQDPYEIFNNRIIFPIKNNYQRVIGFGGRVIGDNLPKYINSPETIVFKKGQTLYGEHEAFTAAYKSNNIILVEGYLDVITFHENGFKQTVASMGTSVNENHLKTLWKYCDEIIICLDGDSAGRRASKRIIDLALPLINDQKNISFLELPDNLDPHDCIVNYGAQYITTLLKNKTPLSSMIWKLEYEACELVTAEDRANLTAKLEKYCLLIQNRVLKYSYSGFFKDQIWNYVVKKQKPPPANSVALLKVEPQFSEVEMFEQGLCSFLLQSSECLSQENIKEFFYNINFKNTALSEFKEWLLLRFEDKNNLSPEILLKQIRRDGFYDIYNLLLKNNHCLQLGSSNKKIDYILLWKILKKKYYIALLKEEYNYIMTLQETNNDNFIKANNYRQEILKNIKKIQQLTETFLN